MALQALDYTFVVFAMITCECLYFVFIMRLWMDTIYNVHAYII